MSCGHDGCTCGPDTTNHELPQAAPAGGTPGGGCCGGHNHGQSDPQH